jgi:DUF4097 and DUF4098 domain-containing protein YvlB
LARTGKRSSILFAGIVLVAAGVVLLIAPRGVGLAVWLERLWPLFLILAGLLRVAGFAIERRPRSPLGGALLVAIGTVLLAARIGSDSNPLRIYGKYWIVVLGIYSLAELLRFYSFRHGDGHPPRLFSVPKLMMIMLIAGTGILSNRVAGSSRKLLEVARIPAGLAFLNDSAVPHAYNFEDAPAVTETSGVGTATISNYRGDISLVGGSDSLRVILIKSVNALGETEAHNLADQIKLVVERSPGGIRISTNRDRVTGDFRTSLRIELPRGLALAVSNNGGAVSLNRADGPLTINATGGAVSVAQIAGNVDIALDGSSSLDASNVGGNVSVEGAKDARITNIGGHLDLKGANGSLDLRDVRGPVKLEASSCKIKAANLVDNSTIKSGDSTIEVIRSSSLAIDGPGSAIRAQQISGDLQIKSSDGSVRLASIQGDVTLSASHSSVTIDGLNGEARVQASFAPVALKNFHGSAIIENSYDRISIAPGDGVAEVQVKNNHGDIRMALPKSGEFQLSAEAAQGSIRCPAVYGNPNPNGPGANLFFGSSGPRIVLTTVQGDIVLEQPGSHRRQ